MFKTHNYKCQGTCSRELSITYDDESKKIVDFEIIGGCNGNLKGIKALIIGLGLKEVHEKFRGLQCGPRETSCPDQIARAIEEIL